MKTKDPAAVALGRKGGTAKSEAKSTAARANASKPRVKGATHTMAEIKKAAAESGCRIIRQEDLQDGEIVYSVVGKDYHHTAFFTRAELEKYFCFSI